MGGWLARSLAHSHARERERKLALNWVGKQSLGWGWAKTLGASQRASDDAARGLSCMLDPGRAGNRALRIPPAGRHPRMYNLPRFCVLGAGLRGWLVICVYCTHCIPGGRRRESRLLLRVAEPRIYKGARFASDRVVLFPSQSAP